MQSAKGQIGAVGNTTEVKIRKVSRKLSATAAVNFLCSPFKTAVVSLGDLRNHQFSEESSKKVLWSN